MDTVFVALLTVNTVQITSLRCVVNIQVSIEMNQKTFSIRKYFYLAGEQLKLVYSLNYTESALNLSSVCNH